MSPFVDSVVMSFQYGVCKPAVSVFRTACEELGVKPERTLEALYLDPLRERVRANGGRVFRGGPTITLLVDIKSEAKTT